ncbi:uncharacterized protein LOC135692038 [Rhopilema esculentum]|uniref:uncharacterized protein LOC135692038 n=1 Tax=Rhopilema esculentum TaxID=499914 RepID=UPI0031D079C1
MLREYGVVSRCLSLVPNNPGNPYTTIAGAIMIIFAFFNILSNSLLIFALYKSKQLRTFSNKFILIMTVSDLCLGIFAQPVLGAFWISSRQRNCLELKSVEFTVTFLGYISFFMIITISIDRYLHVAKPIQYQTMMNNNRMKLLVVSCFISGLVAATISVFQRVATKRTRKASRQKSIFLLERGGISKIKMVRGNGVVSRCLSLVPNNPENPNTTIAGAIMIIFAFYNILSNSLLIFALYKSKQLRTFSNKFILIMTVSDLCLGIFAQPVLGAFWISSRQRNCLELKSVEFTVTFLGYISFFMIITISIDRYLHVAKPIQYQTMMNNNRMTLLVVSCFISGLVAATISVTWTLELGGLQLR